MTDTFVPGLRRGRHNKQLVYIQNEPDPTDTDELAIICVGTDAEDMAMMIVLIMNAYTAGRLTFRESVTSLNEATPPAHSDSQPAGGQDPA